MGVYIPGMEMPKRCGECPLSLYPHSPCWKNGGALDWENRPSWCPLVPVPEHGRLIDADALLEHMKKIHDKWKMGGHYTPTTDDEIMTMNMPTIIPADPPKEEK